MEAARRDGVKRALIEVNFTWQRGLHDLRSVRVMFFTAYDGQDSQVTDAGRLAKFESDGLQRLLTQAALDRARNGSWFESPEHEHPPRRGVVPASTMVVLYDDPWLPLLQPMYGIRDTSWSPLEDAASVGNRVAVKRLLSQGNSRQTDLERALIRAARGDDSWIVGLLLSQRSQSECPREA